MKELSRRPLDTVEGLLLAVDDEGAPMCHRLEGETFIALYSDKEKYAAAVRESPHQGWRCKAITDQQEFLESIAGSGLRLALDAQKTEQGTLRFTEIRLAHRKED